MVLGPEKVTAMWILLGWAVGSLVGELRTGGPVVTGKAKPPLDGHVWAPLDDQASGYEVAGRREAPVVAMIQRCLGGW
jgi:hypothetical protein